MKASLSLNTFRWSGFRIPCCGVGPIPLQGTFRHIQRSARGNRCCRSALMMTKENLGRWLVVGFVSGAVSVLLFHQVIAALLHAIGITPRAPYSMQPTQPLGVAQLWSIVFWGGVWGVVLAVALRKFADSALDQSCA